ncbi:MAG: hypothetical protein JWP86_2761 [Phenylobacterium sp.]|nr:hypothetical protein [Phenylobacterium sp.]MDB5495424.1 hypothetical protein [Phenylobacterium sp.]
MSLGDPGQAGGPPNLPAHIEETRAAIGRLHEQHRQGATPLQKTVASVAGFIGRPRFAGLIALLIVVWVAANLAARTFGLRPIDKPPFGWLQIALAVLALFVTVFILISQRRDDQLSELREQLTLELAMLADQKGAKIIALLEELRRDLPNVHDRLDAVAEELAQPADPEAVLDALKENQTELTPPADTPKAD